VEKDDPQANAHKAREKADKVMEKTGMGKQ